MATKAKDKYIVSFNSDTSDSEDESDSDVKPLPSKPVASVGKETGAALVNGHVEPKSKDALSSNKNSTSSASKTGKCSTGTVQVTSDKTTSSKINGVASLRDKSDVKDDLRSARKVGANTSNNDVSSFDPLSSQKATKEPDNNLGTRKPKSYDSNDLESAYSRAKEKTLLSKTSGKNVESEKSNLLIDFSEATTNSESTKSKVGKTEQKTLTKTAEQTISTTDFEAEMDALFGRNKKSTTESVTNGKPALDFRDIEVKKHDTDIDDGLDADLLIYASQGTQNKPKNKFDFDLDNTTENGPKRHFNIDVDGSEEKTFRRQTSKPDERESLLSPKEKYRNIDEKFSAICSKYGRETKREMPQDKGEAEDDEIYGTVKIKTISKQEGKPPGFRRREDEEEDLGFSEDRTPRQKLNFDDITNWKRTSTDDLIQRILADARGDSKASATGITKGREPRDYAMDAENRYPKMEPYEKDMGPAGRQYDYGQAQPSLLERRLAALGGQEKHEDEVDTYSRPRRQTDLEPYSRPRSAYQDDSEQFYKRKTRGGQVEDIDSYSMDTGEGDRYIPWKERQPKMVPYDDEDDLSCGASARGYQSHLLRPPARYDGDSESDDESYRSTRDRDPVYPDEWFKPTRHEDTAVVVRERTSEVRNMVENQSVVLGRLKKAAESFNDLDAEIRALKQQCIENQVARQAVIEDIMTDMQEDTLEEEPQPAPRRYTRGSYKSSSYSSKYNPSYTPSYDYSRSREGSAYRTFESDHDSNRLGGYALGSIAKSKWGEPGGSRAFRSASVSRFDNVEKEHSYDKYGLYNSRRMRAGSHVDDYDAKSDYSTGDRGDDVETGSVRSHHSDKNTEEDDDSKSSYRSRQTSKYGTYLTPTPSYDTPSYSRPSYSSTRESRSPSRRLMTSSTSDLTFERPRTRGMSLPPPEKPFTSRFLSKVREKKAAGVEISSSRDKPFKSRFLTRSFDSDYHSGSSSRGSLASTPDRNSYSSSSRTYSSRRKENESSENDASAAAE